MFPTVDLLGTPVDTYGLCTLLTLLLVFVCALLFKPKEFPFGYVFGGAVIVLFFFILGAVLWNIITYASEYNGKSIREIFKASGVAYLGGPALSLLALYVYLRAIKVSFLVVADYIAPFFMLDRVIGRFGCLGYGCCYGIPSNLPWAYAFRSWGITRVVPRHPTQAYALVSALAIMISSIYFYKKTKGARANPSSSDGWEKRPLEERKRLIREAPSAGIVFFYVVFWYGALRFFNEFLRAEGPFLYGPVKTVHIIIFVFTAASTIAFYLVTKRSAAKGEILKAFKGASLRLALWLVVSGAVILYLIK